MIAIVSLWLAVIGFAQSIPDSLPSPASQPVYVIPAGPIAGSFTDAARLSITDTVAGWAHIQVEGWVPLGSVINRIQAAPPSLTPDAGVPSLHKNKAATPEAVRQCAATTKSGKQCKRNAAAGSPYCWQHQR
jgi:hypothetical protein